ncbi:esterase/lipase family protein [Amycolatopsis japonica]|uniref:esterase/lipase family protein n=1 Tax=Amycolatopsis japonica TaxID=208439 RepID=UPI0036716727
MIARVLAVLLVFAALFVGPMPGLAVAAKSCAGSDRTHSTPVTQSQSAARRPVVLVHGWTGTPMIETASKLGSQLGEQVSLFTFDYGHWALSWAADEHIAPCLATYLNQVSGAHRKAGGDGRIIVVTHSMGGLALRYAMDAGHVKDAVPAATVPYVVTLGTPHLGSPWGGSGFAKLKTVLDHILGRAQPTTGQAGGDCLVLRDRGDRLPDHCGELPPWLPAGIQLTQIAGDATVDRSLFGFKLYSIPLFSDGIVPVPSAHGYPTSGPTGAPPVNGAKTASRTDRCTIDFGLVNAAARDLRLVPAGMAIDYLTLQDLQNDKFSPPVQAYLGGVVVAAPCSHTRLATDQSAINQTTEVIKEALVTMKKSAPQTKVVKIAGIDKDGKPAAGFAIEDSGTHLDGCDASKASESPDIVRCGPTAAGADVCWIGSGRETLYCGTFPWEKKLLRYTLPAPSEPMAATRTPDPWGLVLSDGLRCRIRNGGAWPGRADEWVGAYSCEGENRWILVRAGMTTAVDRSKPIWTVRVGQLDAENSDFPPPETVSVATAYLAVAP